MELLDWMATWPYWVRVGLMLWCWGIGIHFGAKLADHIFDKRDEAKARRAAQMRNVTPR